MAAGPTLGSVPRCGSDAGAALGMELEEKGTQERERENVRHFQVMSAELKEQRPLQHSRAGRQVPEIQTLAGIES